jgi:hypothetical protein
MSKAESGTGQGQETFAIDGQPIGGPIDAWKRITNDNTPIKGAWEFTNPRQERNGQLNGYNFQFPQGSLADIYIEDSGEQKVFTAMGGQTASLDSKWKVKGIQLYLNSRQYEEEHQGQWTEVNDNARTKIWQPIGVAPRKVETPPTPTTPETPTYAWAERAEQNAKHARALKWALAGIIALGGIATVVHLENPPPYEEIHLQPNQSLEFIRDGASGFAGVIVIRPGSTIYLDRSTIYLSGSTEKLQVDVQTGNALILTSSEDLTLSTPSQEQEDIIIQDKFGGKSPSDAVNKDLALINQGTNIYRFAIGGTLQIEVNYYNQNLCNLGPGIVCTVLK